MQIPFLIEPVDGGRFRAKVGEPLNLCAEGTTADEAGGQLTALVEAFLQRGNRLATLVIGNGKSAIWNVAGLLADDAYKTDWVFQDLQEAMAENRRLDEGSNP